MPGITSGVGSSGGSSDAPRSTVSGSSLGEPAGGVAGKPAGDSAEAADPGIGSPSVPTGALYRDGADRLRPDAVAMLLADPVTRVVDVAEGATLVAQDGPVALQWRPPRADDDQRLVLALGRDVQGAPVLAVVWDGEYDAPAGTAWRGLREVGAALEDLDAEVLMTAVALARWHEHHPRCPRCGEPTVVERAGWVRRCPADRSEHFPRTDPAVIMAITDPADRLLLGRNAMWPAGRFSVLAGFVEPGERLEAAVAREVFEEVGVRVRDVRYAGSQPWPFPASLMLGFTARAESAELRPDADEIVEARWVSRQELSRLVAAGEVTLPGRLSIARRLLEQWYGGPLMPAREATWGRR